MRTMRNRITPIVLAGSMLFAELSSQAQQTKPVYQQTLAVGGTELITIRGDTEKAVVERADIIYSRLVWILADASLARRDVWIDFTQTDPSVYVKNQLLITVMVQDAQYNQSTPVKQAEVWRRRFSETLPILKSIDPPNPEKKEAKQ